MKAKVMDVLSLNAKKIDFRMQVLETLDPQVSHPRKKSKTFHMNSVLQARSFRLRP